MNWKKFGVNALITVASALTIGSIVKTEKAAHEKANAHFDKKSENTTE